MSEAFNPGDLLAGLAANPEMLKNAMQMASALASSGALSGLLGGGGASAPPSPAPEAGPQTPASPPGGGGLADLLAGLMSGQPSASGKSGPATQPPPPPAASTGVPIPSPQPGGGGHKPPSPGHRDRVHLLQAICPFLPEEKREKVQFLIRLLELLSTAEGMGLGKLF